MKNNTEIKIECESCDLLNESDLEDGLHPNSIGHEKIFLRVKDFLAKNKGNKTSQSDSDLKV